MNKQEFRLKYKSWRALLTEEERKHKSEEMTNHFFSFMTTLKCRSIHVFISSDKLNEPDTSTIISTLLSTHSTVKVCTSKLIEGEPRQLVCEVNASTQWQLNKLGIMEPFESISMDAKEIDMVLIPLLAYDVKGNRVGYGKGYYDELLQWCKPEVKKIGLSFFEPDEDLIPTDIWDKALDGVITPEGIIAFEK